MDGQIRSLTNQLNQKRGEKDNYTEIKQRTVTLVSKLKETIQKINKLIEELSASFTINNKTVGESNFTELRLQIQREISVMEESLIPQLEQKITRLSSEIREYQNRIQSLERENLNAR